MTDAVVIIGAGEAGARAASALREQGFPGPVILVGDEAHGPYERPPLSKALMTADTVAAPQIILDEAKLAAHEITHFAGVRATRIDTAAHVVELEDGRTLPYAMALVATGARPRRLAVPGAGPQNVLYLRSFADALAMKARLQPGSRVAVIGGGFIGLEIAASAVERGCAVTLIEMAPRLLMRAVPAEVAGHIEQLHAVKGVDLRLGIGIAAIAREDGAELVHLSDGTTVETDVVIAGIGAIPDTTLAEASGLALDNGIKADGRLRTSAPDVFTAGDCCSFPHPLFGERRLRLEAWRNAQDQGTHVARSMLGSPEPFAAVPWFWSDQFDETLQVAGLADEASMTVERSLGDARLFFHLAGDGRLVGASGVGPNARIAREVRLAEMLIARRATPDPTALADQSVKLKSLLG